MAIFTFLREPIVSLKRIFSLSQTEKQLRSEPVVDDIAFFPTQQDSYSLEKDKFLASTKNLITFSASLSEHTQFNYANHLLEIKWEKHKIQELYPDVYDRVLLAYFKKESKREDRPFWDDVEMIKTKKIEPPLEKPLPLYRLEDKLTTSPIVDPMVPFFKRYDDSSPYTKKDYYVPYIEDTERTYANQNRPLTLEDYHSTFSKYISPENFFNEDKLPTLIKIWEDCRIVNDAFAPLKEIASNYTIDLTGGSVRDFVLNKHHELKDLDFMVSVNHLKNNISRKTLLALQLFTEEELDHVGWKNETNHEETCVRLIHLCINRFHDLSEQYYFNSTERDNIIGEKLYDNIKSPIIKKDRLVAVFKTHGKLTHYPMDFLLTNWIKPQFIKDFDFDLCKASFCIVNTLYKKEFPTNPKHFISRFSAERDFWADVVNKTVTYNATERSEKHIQRSFGDHLERIMHKYPDYTPMILNEHAFKYAEADTALLFHTLHKNMPSSKKIKRSKI